MAHSLFHAVEVNPAFCALYLVNRRSFTDVSQITSVKDWPQHSERRDKLGETDAFINQKVRFALVAGLDVIPSLDEVPELDVVGEASNRWVFLESWAYVTDGESRGSFGQSGAVLVPEALAGTVVDDGVELSQAIDAFAGGHNIRDAEGAWGILTRNLSTRQDSFRAAVISAFAPFFNRELYAASDHGASA